MAVEEVGFNAGEHNANLEQHRVRLLKQGFWKDQSTICITTTKGSVEVEVFVSWFAMRVPMNQRLGRTFIRANSTAAGYNELVKDALEDEHAWTNILFLEDDVIVPPETLVKLITALEVTGAAAAGALCWTRQENGVPMLMGNPLDPLTKMLPQVPQDGGYMPVSGIHLGCTMVRAAVFRDKRWGKRPWFFEGEPPSEIGIDAKNMTADMAFFTGCGQLGYRVVCDTSLEVGHHDRRTRRTF